MPVIFMAVTYAMKSISELTLSNGGNLSKPEIVLTLSNTGNLSKPEIVFSPFMSVLIYFNL